jgi:hypothetical protein
MYSNPELLCHFCRVVLPADTIVLMPVPHHQTISCRQNAYIVTSAITLSTFVQVTALRFVGLLGVDTRNALNFY